MVVAIEEQEMILILWLLMFPSVYQPLPRVFVCHVILVANLACYGIGVFFDVSILSEVMTLNYLFLFMSICLD